MKRTLSILSLCAIALLFALVSNVQKSAAQEPDDQGVLASFISRLLSTPTSQVRIGAVEGALSSQATIRDISVSDANGVWLSVDRVTIDWRRAALFQRTIDVTLLSIGRLEIARLPLPSTQTGEPGPLLPELPLRLQVNRFELAELVLGAPLLGEAARLTSSGSAQLGPPEEGLQAELAVRRLDRGGEANLRLSFMPNGEQLTLGLQHVEPQGGIAARLAGLAGLPPVQLDLQGSGTLDDWNANLSFNGGPGLNATGGARIQRDGADRRLTLDVNAIISALLPPQIAQVYPGAVTVRGDISFAQTGAIALRQFQIASTLAVATLDGSIAADRALALEADLTVTPPAPVLQQLGLSRLERLGFVGSIIGPLERPAFRGRLDLANLVAPALAVGSITGDVSALPEPSGSYAFQADMNALGLAPADPGIAAALGPEIRFSANGTIGDESVATIREARLNSPTLSLAYSGRLGPSIIDGPLRLEAPDLGVLSILSGLRLGGSASIEAALRGNPGERQVRADITGETTNLTLGDPRIDQALGGRLTLAGAVSSESGTLRVENLLLISPLLDLGLNAVLGANASIEAALRITAKDNRAAAAAIGVRRLGRFSFDGTVSGTLESPAIGGSIDLADLQTPIFSLASVTGRFDAVPAPGEAGRFERGRFALTSDVRLGGFSSILPGLAEALGTDFDFMLRTTIGEEGIALVDRARLSSDTTALTYTGRLGASEIAGTLNADIDRLNAYQNLARRDLSGRAAVKLDLSGAPAEGQVNARVAGQTAGLALGDPRLDRLIGNVLRLSGGVSFAGGALAFDSFKGTGQGLEATLNGNFSLLGAALGAELAFTNLALLDPRLSGRANATARYDSNLLRSSAALRISAASAAALDRPIRDLDLSATIANPFSAAAIAVTGSGRIGGNVLSLDAQAKAGMGEGTALWQIDRLAAGLGSAQLEGRGTVDAAGLVVGTFSFAADHLDDLSPVALRKLSGSLRLGIRAAAANGQQRFELEGNANRFTLDMLRLEAFEARLAIDDAFGRFAISGDALAAGLTAAGERFERIALAARGDGETNNLTFTGRARGFDLAAAADVRAGPPVALRLQRFSASRNGRRITLAVPAALVLADGGFRTERLTLRTGEGTLTLSGNLGSTLDAQIVARTLPLSVIRVFAPAVAIEGSLDASATLKGPAASPRGPFRIAIAGLRHPVLRDSGIAALAVSANGNLADGRALLEATLRGDRRLSLTAAGSLPLGGGTLDLALRGTLDAALANARLAASGQRVSGRVGIDASITGTFDNPRAEGSVTLARGRFDYPALGLSLQAIEGRARLAGETITIERLVGRPRGGGSISATGRIGLAAGFPAALDLRASEARLVEAPLARLVADLALSVTGPLASSPRIAGRVRVRQFDIRVPDRLPAASEPLRDARHVKPPRQTQARLAVARRQAVAGRASGVAPFRAALDVRIDAPSRIFLRGRGIDAELGGAVRITGTSVDPQANGAFDLRRGRLSILTQRLDFRRGRIVFAPGDFIPDIDLVAETRAGNVTARIVVEGPANQPRFTLSSTPELPEDEVLARLLFARAAGGLSPFQAVQLAQAVAQLAGTSAGPDVFESARRGLGVDDLDIGVGSNGATLGLSRAINDRVRLNARTGTRPEDSAVGVDIDLTRQLRARSEVGADGRTSVGIGVEIEY